MFIAMHKGNAKTPARFWARAVAENESEVSQLQKAGYVKANINLQTLQSAKNWIR